MTLSWPALVLALAAGLALGSYAVTAGLRFSRAQGSTMGRSRCDACGVSLGFAQTVPVASFLRLRGACASCGAPIDRIHLAGEVAGGLVAASAVWAAEPLRAAPLAILGLALVAASTIDIKVQRLPDLFTGVVAVAALALSALHGVAALEAGALAAAVSVGVLSLVRLASARSRGDPGLGWGDVKLVAALALWLGAGTPVMVAVAAALGLVAAPFVRDEHRRLPFGPMIAVAAWLVGMCAERGWTPWVL